jgi:hypothetical protein
MHASSEITVSSSMELPRHCAGLGVTAGTLGTGVTAGTLGASGGALGVSLGAVVGTGAGAAFREGVLAGDVGSWAAPQAASTNSTPSSSADGAPLLGSRPSPRSH